MGVVEVLEVARAAIGELPDGRAKSIALTKIDEAEMWSLKAGEEDG